MCNILFIYGTLKTGFSRNSVLTDGIFGIGRKIQNKIKTVPGYRLYDLGAFPALVASKNGIVEGELWEVDDVLLSIIDQIEGHPHAYRRTPIELIGNIFAESYMLEEWRINSYPIIQTGIWGRVI